MTIRIDNQELEALLKERLASGRYESVEDLLLEVLRDFHREPKPFEGEQKKRADEAAARMLELRKGVKLDRPKGMTLRQFAHIGHKW